MKIIYPTTLKRCFSLPDNSEENEASIKTLINHKSLENNLRKKIISKQDYIFKTFEGVPEDLWSYLLLEEKVIISWQNISKYLSCKENNKEVVTDLLKHKHIIDTLSTKNISTKDLGEENSQSLSGFILNNDEITNLDYCKLIKCLPYHYKNFPENISNEKIKCLAKANVVKLNKDSFNFVEDNYQLTTILISENFTDYLKEKNHYPISNDVRKLLLASEISDKNKLIVAQDISSLSVEESELSRLIANLLISNEIDSFKF